MRTVSGVATSRAAPRRRAASAKWAQRAQTVRARLHIESPLGMAGVCLGTALVLAAAMFPLPFSSFTFALRTVIGLPAYEQPLPENRVGAILFTPFDGNACRKVSFDNRTGAFGPEEHIRCYGDTSATRQGGSRGGDRMSLIRQAFTTSPAR